MARPLRIEYNGAFYHVMARGNEKRTIYLDDPDRRRFLSFLESGHQRFGALYSAYCLMNNHYHLLLETPRGNLSQILHHINAGYTTYFNVRHRRVGHLLQGRFRSILVEKDSYALELSRYIHLNPVRAGLVAKPEQYQWSSYRTIVSPADSLPYLSKDTILSHFGTRPTEAYQDFVLNGMHREAGNPLKEAVASSILGSETYVEWVKDTFLRQAKRSRDIPARNALIRKPTLQMIDRIVRQTVQNPKVARKVSVFISHRLSGCQLKEIGNYFNLSDAGVTLCARRLEALMESNQNLRAVVTDLESRIGTCFLEM